LDEPPFDVLFVFLWVGRKFPKIGNFRRAKRLGWSKNSWYIL